MEEKSILKTEILDQAFLDTTNNYGYLEMRKQEEAEYGGKIR